MPVVVRKVVIVACGMLVLAACGQQMQPVEISVADVSEDGLTVELVINACAQEWEESVEESADSVVVGYRITTKTGDCGFSGVITLASPLGNRVLIDEYNNEPIPLTPWPGLTSDG